MSKFYNIDTSTNLGGVDASDIKVSSQKSIKTYIDGSLQTVAYIGSDDSISDIVDSSTGKQVDISLYAEKLWVHNQGYLTLQTLPSDLGKQSDWTQTDDTQVDFIKNKPNFATVATSGSYTDLDNKPTIPTVNNGTLTIQKNGISVGTFMANDSSDKSINIIVPTKTSEITNDSGFLTSHQDISGKQDTLVSGTNIKTINGVSLLGSGNVNIDAGFVHTANTNVNGSTATVTFTANTRGSAMLTISSDIGLTITCNNESDNYLWIKNTGSVEVDVIISGVTANGTSVSNVYIPSDGITVPAGGLCEIGIIVNSDGAFLTSRNDLIL